VRGTSLALGYYNNPEESAKAFCQNPLHSHYAETIYRTGDLGKYNDWGELLFLARKDSQVKHMGHRIELGDIEVAVNALSFLDAACCLYDPIGEKIVLFYQSVLPCDREIMISLRDHLPKYMLPNRLIHFQQLPMNKNAKIDRAKLKEQYLDEVGR
jgi:acyl-coenzyme A synthetase/AMP-(fatty) acid ligase